MKSRTTLQSFVMDRLSNGETVYGIAKKLRVSQPLVSGWKNGKTTKCYPSTVKKIYASYGIDMSHVVAEHRRGKK